MRLNGRLRDAPAELLVEVLCHELAHVVAYELNGRNCRPHGPEWASLMRQAGYAPRIRIDIRDLPVDYAAWLSAQIARRASTEFVHRCPVCQASRIAGRPVRRWRCLRCREAGLDGVLTITRLEPPNDR